MSDGGIVTSRKRGYTLIYNDMLVKGMSARAWGVYCYLVSKPDGWETRMSDLQGVFKEGRDALVTARDELVTLGYLRRETYYDNHLERVRFVLDGDQEKPSTAQTRRSAPETGLPEPGGPAVANPPPGPPPPGNPPQVSTDVATTEQPTTDQCAALRDGAGGEAPDARAPEARVAKAVYDATDGAVSFMGMQTIAKWAIQTKRRSPEDVEAAMMALYRTGLSVMKVTVAQVLDGILVPAPNGTVARRTTGRAAEREAQNAAWAQSAERLRLMQGGQA